jgi:hypothetical protein
MGPVGYGFGYSAQGYPAIPRIGWLPEERI